MKNIIITRSGKEGKKLVDKLNQNNFCAIYFPLFEIQALSVEPLLLKQDSLVIFVSPNAVNLGIKYLSNLNKIAIVGNGTLRELNKQGFDTDIIPSKEFNTEGLLAHPSLQDVKNKQIIIVRGKGGREKLRTELIRRGAFVQYFEVYKRKPINVSVLGFNTKAIDIVQISNQEVLKRIIPLVKKLPWFNHCQWWLLSDRTKKACSVYGIKEAKCKIIKPGNEAFIKELLF